MPTIIPVGNPNAGATVAAGAVHHLLAVRRPIGLFTDNLKTKLLVVGGPQKVDAPIAAEVGIKGHHLAVGRYIGPAGFALLPIKPLVKLGLFGGGERGRINQGDNPVTDTIKDEFAAIGQELTINTLLAEEEKSVGRRASRRGRRPGLAGIARYLPLV